MTLHWASPVHPRHKPIDPPQVKSWCSTVVIHHAMLMCAWGLQETQDRHTKQAGHDTGHVQDQDSCHEQSPYLRIWHKSYLDAGTAALAVAILKCTLAIQ